MTPAAFGSGDPGASPPTSTIEALALNPTAMGDFRAALREAEHRPGLALARGVGLTSNLDVHTRLERPLVRYLRVEVSGFEPPTSTLRTWRSAS
jgi:hypothetical protein